jgi:chromosome segregation ATPase
MTQRNRWMLIAVLLATTIAGELAAQTVIDKGKYERAKEVANLAEVRAANKLSQVENAEGTMATAAGQIRFLEEHLATLTDALQAYENEVIAAHPEDSHLRTAIADAERAEAAYVAAQRSVLASAAYKSAYDAAKSAPNKAEALPRVRKDFLERDKQCNDAYHERAAARKRLDVARQEVLNQDDQWVETIAEVRAVKAEIAAAVRLLERGQLADAAASSAYLRTTALGARAEAYKQLYEKVTSSGGKAKGNGRGRGNGKGNGNYGKNRKR